MNLAIEYLLRGKRVHNLLTLPCSLFLIGKDNKLVVTIHNSYGGSNLLVKHWKVNEAKSTDKLPPFIEFAVVKDNIFVSPYTIVPEYEILTYNEEPFVTGDKQYADWTHAYHQETEYIECLDNFCNTKLHKTNRLIWLWKQFESIYLLGKFYHGSDSIGKYWIPEKSEIPKALWYTWQYWRKHLLDFDGAAAELVFRCDYPIHPEPPPPKKPINHYNISPLVWLPNRNGDTTASWTLNLVQNITTTGPNLVQNITTTGPTYSTEYTINSF